MLSSIARTGVGTSVPGFVGSASVPGSVGSASVAGSVGSASVAPMDPAAAALAAEPAAVVSPHRIRRAAAPTVGSVNRGAM